MARYLMAKAPHAGAAPLAEAPAAPGNVRNRQAAVRPEKGLAAQKAEAEGAAAVLQDEAPKLDAARQTGAARQQDVLPKAAVPMREEDCLLTEEVQRQAADAAPPAKTVPRRLLSEAVILGKPVKPHNALPAPAVMTATAEVHAVKALAEAGTAQDEAANREARSGLAETAARISPADAEDADC
jgi:hypothetical protein